MCFQCSTTPAAGGAADGSNAYVSATVELIMGSACELEDTDVCFAIMKHLLHERSAL
jgi:hypothetical protein